MRATNIVDNGFEGSSADVETPAGRLRLTARLPGRAQLLNVLAGVAVAMELGVGVNAIETRVASFRPLTRRGSMRTSPDGARVVDDSYNASPAAVRAMLAALAATPTAGRRIAVLGEMLELGASAPCAARRLRPRGGCRACGRAGRGRRTRRGRSGGRRERGWRAARAHPPVRRQRRRGVVCRAARRTRRPRARERIARDADRRDRGPVDGGGLMLYHLLAPLESQISVMRVVRVHHLPHGGGQPHRAGAQPAARPVAHPPAARIPDRPGRPHGRPREPQAEGRDADDGRPADSGGGVRADAALGGSDAIRSSGSPCWRRRRSARLASSTTT